MTTRNGLIVAALIVCLVSCGCGGSSGPADGDHGGDEDGDLCATGTLGCACHGNHSCNQGLDCIGDTCVPGVSDGDTSPDGDAADGDRDSEGEIPVDGDSLVDGDQCPAGGAGCPCRSDGSCDTGLVCDAGLCQPAGDGDTPVDGDLPAVGLSVSLLNRGDEAAYVVHHEWPYAGHLGLTLLEEGTEVSPSPGCAPDCDGPCEPVFCEPMVPRVLQVLPGASINYRFPPDIYRFDTCQSPDFGVVRCHRRGELPSGPATLRFCRGVELADTSEETVRTLEDTIAPARVRDPVCTDFPLLLEVGMNRLDESFAVSLNPGAREFGSCGTAWTWNMFFQLPLQPGSIGPVDEGCSLVIPIGPFILDRTTLLPGDIRCWAGPGERTVSLSYGAFESASGLGHGTPQMYHACIVPPLETGAWRAEVETYTGQSPPAEPFAVEVCPGCMACPATPAAGLGEACEGDCDCRVGGSVCHQGRCALFCLDNRTCPAGHDCRAVEGSITSLHRCQPVSRDACRWETDCQKGFACVSPAGEGLARCQPVDDMRGITQPRAGLGFRCGCDAECPGAQRCVRYPINFTDGRCARACRDGRDCPAGWECLGMTQSGLQAVCIRKE